MIERARWFLSLLLWCASVQAALPPLLVDGDGDGISDEVDDCLYTPPGIQVNELGCPLLAEDGDADGVADPQDDCPYTPPGAEVDSRGCARDADFDGIANGIDRCGNTALAAVVDTRGCAAGQTPSALAVSRPATVLPEPLTVLASSLRDQVVMTVQIPVASLPLVPAPLAAPPPPSPSESLRTALLAEEQARATGLVSAPALQTPPRPAATEPPPTRTEAPAAAAAPTQPLPESLSESLGFAARSAELSPQATRKLDELAPVLRALANRNAEAYLSVAAFADRHEGTRASRYAIQRSELVRAWLLAHGVPRERIRTSIRVLDAGTSADNRRVEIRSAP